MLNAAIPFPDWLVMCRTILIPKKGEANDLGNYRPIANDLLPQEQCALRRVARGCVDCLAVDKMVITDARFKGLRTSKP